MRNLQLKKSTVTILVGVFLLSLLLLVFLVKEKSPFFSRSPLNIIIRSYLEQDLRKLDAQKIKKMLQIRKQCFEVINKQNLRAYLAEKYSEQSQEISDRIISKKIDEWNLQQEKSFKRKISSQKGWVLALLEDELVGMYHCSRDWDLTNGDKMIFSLCVENQYRGRGIGKKLIKNSLEHCREKNNYLNLLVEKFNLKALQLYQNLGFQIISPEKTPDDDLLLYGRHFMRYMPKEQTSP